MKNLLQFVFFILKHGDKIAEQLDQLKELVDWLIENYEDTDEARAMSDSSVDLDAIADKFPEVAAACEQCVGQRTRASSFVGRRGAFADLIKWIIENPDQVIELINFFRDLFDKDEKTQTAVTD